jgi:hypothetical protein
LPTPTPLAREYPQILNSWKPLTVSVVEVDTVRDWLSDFEDPEETSEQTLVVPINNTEIPKNKKKIFALEKS